MTFLSEDELKNTYNSEAQNMDSGNVTKYLKRANAYAYGVIGGQPTFSEKLPEDQLKTAVAMAFEIFAEGQDAQVNQVNGRITQNAPEGYTKKESKTLETVTKMLEPYKEAVASENAGKSDYGMAFL